VEEVGQRREGKWRERENLTESPKRLLMRPPNGWKPEPELRCEDLEEDGGSFTRGMMA
jgi:hypothetical protein